MSDNQFVDIKVMGYEFRVACPSDEVTLLKQAVNLLNQRMEEIRSTGKIVGAERIAMMAALSISHDALKTSDIDPVDITRFKGRIDNINNLIDSVLDKADRLL